MSIRPRTKEEWAKEIQKFKTVNFDSGLRKRIFATLPVSAEIRFVLNFILNWMSIQGGYDANPTLLDTRRIYRNRSQR